MGTVEKLQAAKFDEGNIAACKFNFKRPAVTGGAKQHGLLLQRHTGLTIGQHLVDNEVRLLGFAFYCHELRPLE
ncbi:hypothetical protein D3C80_1554030 [compost metagenome]